APALPAPVVVSPAVTATRVAIRRPRRTAAQRLIAVARRKLGDRYVYGAMGPRHFDCSGLVIFALRHSHNGPLLHPSSEAPPPQPRRPPPPPLRALAVRARPPPPPPAGPP